MLGGKAQTDIPSYISFMAPDLYATLGVSRDADAASIKRAYLKLARETHPDKNPGDADANDRFQALGRAYAILRDEEKRKLYDKIGAAIGSGPPTIWCWLT